MKPKPRIVSPAEWLAARKGLLVKEKELSRLRDDLSRQRRELPWVKLDQTYRFSGPDGAETLADLFAGRRQLIVYHFMFDPTWDEGCKSCSFLADNFEGSMVHLAHRDVTMVVVSRAPLAKLQAFRQRMGWQFKWLSSFESDFNVDFGVSFRPEDVESGRAQYNYAPGTFPMSEAPGLSVFYRDEDGSIYHTYSTYARGLDMFLTTYHLLDTVPKGRDEEGLPYGMAWLRHHDRYE
jgi:predicted dithiol-disulfide oxidoreductase (DUF899 family)